MITVFLAKAIICFAGNCYPVLVGPKTPLGDYPTRQRFVESPGYGGDVLQFTDDGTTVLAVHRVWMFDKKHNRWELLEQDDASKRVGITNGCINVMPPVYDALIDCCAGQTISIQP